MRQQALGQRDEARHREKVYRDEMVQARVDLADQVRRKRRGVAEAGKRAQELRAELRGTQAWARRVVREVRALRKLTPFVMVNEEAVRLLAEWDRVAVKELRDE